MAASDQTYRNQKALDVVFGVSCVLMLASIVWMFADDYNRSWKKEQRAFRDVQEAMDERFALSRLPDPAELIVAEKRVSDEKDKLAKKSDRLQEIESELDSQ